jgi:hypothetical protein
MNAAQQIQAGIDFDFLMANAEKRITVDVPVLFDKDGNGTAGFRIVGKNSAEYRNEQAAIRVEGTKRGAKNSTAIDTSTDEGAQRLVELVDDNQARIACAVAVETYGFTSGGVEVQLSKEQKATAFDKYPTWVERVTAQLDKDADFLKV